LKASILFKIAHSGDVTRANTPFFLFSKLRSPMVETHESWSLLNARLERRQTVLL